MTSNGFAGVSSARASIADNTSGGRYAYRASKAGLNMVNRSLSYDLSGQVTCVVFHPGWVATDAALRSLAAIAAERGVPEAAVQVEIEGAQDIPGLMQPADVAPLYLFLASPLAASITGQGINIDRGELQA